MKASRTIHGIEIILRASLLMALVLNTMPLAAAQLALALSATPWAAVQSANAKSDEAALAAAKRRAAKPPGGPQEGIKVHGRWVIEVRNPDGTLTARHEFNNALSDGGRQALALLLSRSHNSPGKWLIGLTGPTGPATSPCNGGIDAQGNPSPTCRIIEPGSSNPRGGNSESANLQISLTGPLGGTTVTLTGSVTALVSATVGRVFTSFATCPTSPCNLAGAPNLFSDASLGFPGTPSPVPVVAGQIIQVTVVFTFS
jgi:hypothetical protein